MTKTLVAYFSATGTTKSIAIKIADIIKGDIFEIEPKIPYTAQDLDWTNPSSRSTLEMKDKDSRPQITKTLDNIDDYDTILLGFPVWWYEAPRIINTFIDSAVFIDKTIIPFCTSGISDICTCQAHLQADYSLYKFINGKRLKGNETKENIINWLEKYL